MRQEIFTILENSFLTPDVCRVRLAGDTGAITRPGQFVDLKLDGFFLRRPLSVCDWQEGELTLLYKLQGGGTRALSRLAPGAQLDLLVGLGNGYDTAKSGARPLLVGGGVGVPPLFALARRLLAEGKTPTAVLGFNREEEILLADELTALGVRVLLATADGSRGVKGFVTDAMASLTDYTYVYTCGPEPMLRAVYAASRTSGQFSFEERMGCGFGACMGCSCETKYGTKRICRDGPVLEKEEIVW